MLLLYKAKINLHFIIFSGMAHFGLPGVLRVLRTQTQKPTLLSWARTKAVIRRAFPAYRGSIVVPTKRANRQTWQAGLRTLPWGPLGISHMALMGTN